MQSARQLIERLIQETAELGRVQISAHRSGDVVWLDWFCVPAELRHHGIGTTAYKAWEATLPKDVKYVKLYAADAGAGRSNQFWDRLGFDYCWSGDDGLKEFAYEMQKGVNGHKTPPPQAVHED